MKDIVCIRCGWTGQVFDPDNEIKNTEIKCFNCGQVGFILETLDFKFLSPNTKRGMQWVLFADVILKHIEEYTVPQYGDAPDDQVELWTSHDCVRAIGRYSSRFGRNSRDDQELLDLKKIAHYACLAYNKEIKHETN